LQIFFEKIWALAAGLRHDHGAVTLEASMTTAQIRQVADFLLSLQDAAGMIADAPGAAGCNLDSNMEYALMGLGAAYRATGDARYLAGLEQGIDWLAGRMEMTDPQFRGSFRYAYTTSPPYDPLPTSPGPGIDDVRGVDASSALFVHLLALHKELTGSTDLATRYSAQGHAALDFLMQENRGADGFFFSSWQHSHRGWDLWRYQYAADQGDVYLGFRAGADLYESHDPGRYSAVADFLISRSLPAFFDASTQRFGVGKTGQALDSLDGINGVFGQGYLGWIMGNQPQSLAALTWLADGARADGGLRLFPGDPGYALSAAVYALAVQGTGRGNASDSLTWLAGLIDASGGVADSQSDPVTTSNIAGFALMALTSAAARQDWRVSSGDAGADRLWGGAHRDVLLGQAGNDEVQGRLGADLLAGGLGQDGLAGGIGRDVFLFTCRADSTPTQLDTIRDFQPGRDVIDLTQLDASTLRPGNQVLHFIGSVGFSHHAGQLRVSLVDHGTRIEADLTGDGRADFAIDLTGHLTLTTTDFLL